MNPRDDSTDEMGEVELDERTADLLLDGQLAPEDAPPEYVDVIALVRALALPPTAGELSGQSRAVARSLAERAMRPQPRGSKVPVNASARTRPPRSRFFKAKVASLVVVGTLAGTTGLAMAGTLPAPVQDVASKVLAKVGISAPTSDEHPASSGEDISKIATTTDATGVDKGAEISTAASGGHSHAGQNGASTDHTNSRHPTDPGSTKGKSTAAHDEKSPQGHAVAKGQETQPSSPSQGHGKP